ncbi:MAG: hypothetical protein HY585_03070 [Candidatus Omnitrophica bacterium]|nr:hypothetical protein [Candidatus Omnitrophota bacterium]
MKASLLRIGIMLSFLMMNGSQASFADDLSAKVEVDRAFATIGDRINFRITVTHQPEISILEIDAADVLRDFEIKESTPFSHKEKGTVSEGKNFVLVNYTLGEYVIRPMTIQYRTKEGELKKLSTNSLYITIQSIDKNKAENSDIRGVKGVRKLEKRFWLWILAIILLTTGASFWYFFRRKQIPQNQPSPEEALLPHEEAYQALNRLRNSDLLRKGQVKVYFFQVSEILRRYFERRYHIRALESTTYELTKDLKDKVASDHFKLIQEVLAFCDLVKFAKYNPEPAEILRQNNQSKLIIDVTKEEITPSPPETVIRSI